MQPESLPPGIRSLTRPEAYPHSATNIHWHETHISWVFLAGEFAYKIKKPVNLGFVDFTTLQRREHFCREELRLNTRLAPELYLDVVPIIGTDTEWRISGSLDPGAMPLEFAVKMQRFPEDSLLSNPDTRSRLKAAHFRQLARDVARFHLEATPADASASWGDPAKIHKVVLDNFPEIERYPLTSLHKQQLDHLEAWLNQKAREVRELQRARAAAGVIREGHGDMHLQNMILRDDRIRVFDCIEFNDAFRWIDPINEIAFITMDLQDRGLSGWAHVFLAEYLQQTGDFAGLALFNYYQVYRALVRAKVNAIRFLQTTDPRERQEIETELYRYLDLATRITAPPAPFLAITCGFSGSGKSTLAAALVEQTGVLWLRSDVERKRIYENWPALAPPSPPVAPLPTEPYSTEGIETVYARLLLLAELILKTGHAVIVDATFLKRDQRHRFQKLAQNRPCTFRIYYLDSQESLLRDRIAARTAAADNVSDATDEVLEQQRREFEDFTTQEHSFLASASPQEP